MEKETIDALTEFMTLYGKSEAVSIDIQTGFLVSMCPICKGQSGIHTTTCPVQRVLYALDAEIPSSSHG